MKTLSPRIRTLIYAGLAVLALLLLSTTLNALQLEAGQPLPIRELAPQVMDTAVDDDLSRLLLAFFRVVLILLWVLIPVYVLLLVFSKDARKRFIRTLMIYLPIIILLYILAGNVNNDQADEEVVPGGFEMGNIAEGFGGDPEAVLPEYQPPAPWVTTLTTVLLAASITLAIAGFGFMLYRRSRNPALQSLELIQQEAQSALDDIEAGGDLREVIMRSYLQMVQALKQYRNIQRDRDMTPHEFQEILEKRGLPREPVRQLTQLFEQVRYGGAAPGRQDERAAIASLNAIINACQRTGKS